MDCCMVVAQAPALALLISLAILLLLALALANVSAPSLETAPRFLPALSRARVGDGEGGERKPQCAQLEAAAGWTARPLSTLVVALE